MGVQLSDVYLVINNEVIAHTPNSVKFTDGFGEQSIRAASTGGGNVERIYSNNVENNFSKCMFDMPATVDNIEKVRDWKANFDQNLIQIQGQTSDGKILTRTISNAALINDVEIALGSDTDISLEFAGAQAI